MDVLPTPAYETIPEVVPSMPTNPILKLRSI